jgi:hypothetical protein
MNRFEQQIVIQLLEGVFFNQQGKDITPEKCKQATIKYSPEFPWEDDTQLRKAIFSGCEFPVDMVFLACKTAWESVDWKNVAIAVKQELESDRVDDKLL